MKVNTKCYMYTNFNSPLQDLYTEVFSSRATVHTLFWEGLWTGLVPEVLELTLAAIGVRILVN